jgi:hypothetical protein
MLTLLSYLLILTAFLGQVTGNTDLAVLTLLFVIALNVVDSNYELNQLKKRQ